MKVGFVQMRPVFGETEKNVLRAEGLIRKGKEADLLVLPEFFSTGYRFANLREAFDLAEPVPGGPTTRRMLEAAGKHRLLLAFGINERAGSRIYNSAVLVAPGGLKGKYRKAHLFGNEKRLFTAGRLGFPVFRAGGVKIGLLVCFDWIFPEPWRIEALAGAQIICHPANLVIPEKCQRAMPTRAAENRIFTVTANRTGAERGVTFTGRSIICGPGGEKLAAGPPRADRVAVVDIDPARAKDKKATPDNDIFRDRRPDIYGDLIRARKVRKVRKAQKAQKARETRKVRKTRRARK